MKKIICIRGEADSGKTTIVKRVYNKLTDQVCTEEEINTSFTYKGLSIAIFSQGDPNTKVVVKLKKYIKKQSTIIVCCARTGEEEENKIYENEFLPFIQVKENIVGYEYQKIETEKFKEKETDKYEEQYERLSSKIINEIEEYININQTKK